MKGIEGLIRLQRWRLDEARRRLADLERLREEFRDKQRRLDQEVEAEQRAAAADPDGQRAWANFAARALERRATLARSAAETDAAAAAAHEEVSEAFREVKKLELAAERAERRQLEVAQRREQTRLDAVALETHRRRGVA
jgi:flagellar protein FliJ